MPPKRPCFEPADLGLVSRGTEASASRFGSAPADLERGGVLKEHGCFDPLLRQPPPLRAEDRASRALAALLVLPLAPAWARRSMRRPARLSAARRASRGAPSGRERLSPRASARAGGSLTPLTSP